MANAGPPADAELLAACREFERVEQQLKYLAVHSLRTPFGDPRTIAHEAEVERLTDAWDEAIQPVIDTPATTPDGIRAKTAALWAALEREARTATPHELLAYSLARDILGSAPP